jgi:hypothetical protein
MSNPSQHMLGFCLCSQLRRHRSYLHPDRRRTSAIGRADLQNPSPSRSCIGRGRIRFLGNDLTRLLAILSSTLLIRLHRPCCFDFIGFAASTSSTLLPQARIVYQYVCSVCIIWFDGHDLYSEFNLENV